MRQRLIVVSNRLPVTVARGPAGLRLEPSCGGLVTALLPVLRENAGCWVGWTGTSRDPAIAGLLERDSTSCFAMVPVFLTPAETDRFYRGCSNEIIWPLFHDLPSRCNFDAGYWESYRDVNAKFAAAVEPVARRGDFIWVHDYHLMLFARAMRARGTELRLAYFHHIPFPPPDIFEKLPWRSEILRALLDFDTVGFQTVRDRQNFIACLRRCLSGVHIRRDGDALLAGAGSACAAVGSFPISIAWQELASQAAHPDIAARAGALRRGLPGCRIALGVDRLDYTKGIPQRLLAFRSLLERYPELRCRVALIQVVVPSREEIPYYHELKQSIEQLVSEINGEYSTPGWVPVHYMHRRLARPELLALYRAADVALVTPLKDGMNLVAKEYCAANADESGALVLSEFAGAAAELRSGALLVNPNDTIGLADMLRAAFLMSPAERRRRMRRMRETVRRHDVFEWCDRFFRYAGVSPEALTHPFAAAG
ncbi:MAG: alpha,alpha-trehalose-phosphate synthase (UDP-forming) [Acidobacteriota bacterium]